MTLRSGALVGEWRGEGQMPALGRMGPNLRSVRTVREQEWEPETRADQSGRLPTSRLYSQIRRLKGPRGLSPTEPVTSWVGGWNVRGQQAISKNPPGLSPRAQDGFLLETPWHWDRPG